MTLLDEKYNEYFRRREEEKSELDRRIDHAKRINQRRENHQKLLDFENRLLVIGSRPLREDPVFEILDRAYGWISRTISERTFVDNGIYYKCPPHYYTAKKIVETLIGAFKKRKINEAQYKFLSETRNLCDLFLDESKPEFQDAYYGSGRAENNYERAQEVAVEKVLTKHGFPNLFIISELKRRV